MANVQGLVHLPIMIDVVMQALVVVGIALSMVNTMPIQAVMVVVMTVGDMDGVEIKQMGLASEARLDIEAAPVLPAKTMTCLLLGRDISNTNLL